MNETQINESITAIGRQIDNDILAYIRNEDMVNASNPSDKQKQLYEIINTTHAKDLDQLISLLDIQGSKNLTADDKGILKRVIVEEEIAKLYIDELMKSKGMDERNATVINPQKTLVVNVSS